MTTKPFARHYHQARAAGGHASGTQYTPAQVAAAYSFPAGLTGKGVKVGVIELGGAFSASDFQTFCAQNGLTPPAVNVVAVNGAAIAADPGGADVEVMLDVEVLAAVAPGAVLEVYFADNSSAGFVAAFAQSLKDGCQIVSCSWGAPEDQWGADMAAMDAQLKACVAAGVTVYVASGDSGSSDGEKGKHVDYPASSQYVVACGGTTLQASGGKIVSEAGWSGSGGGVSAGEPKPAWQTSTLGAKRLVPDVAGNADPETGYLIVSGGQMVVGGTSAVAPLWVALHALLIEAIGPTGFLAPKLYALGELVFQDTLSGSNGAYKTGPGFDLVTGLGTPSGTKVLAGLRATATPPPPAPAPAPRPGAAEYVATLDANKVVVQEWSAAQLQAIIAEAIAESLGFPATARK